MNGFSVIMPTYNQSGFIKRAILSLYQQTYTNWELIIINDGCCDYTEKYINAYLSDKRIVYIKNDVNRGMGFAINQGLDIARYNYIAYLPSDDYFYNNHLHLLARELDKSEEIVLAVSGITFVDRTSSFSSDTSVSNQIAKGYPLQLVQTAHKKTDDRWTEREELVSDDLFSLFWYKLINKGIISFTRQITVTWTMHPHQRHKMIAEIYSGGINYYRHYYNVKAPLKLQSKESMPIDEEKLYAFFSKKGKFSKDGLKILIVGELAYNPERILALEELGHKLYGLWVEGAVLSFDTIGPLPFGNVTDIPYKNWKEEIKKIQPDIIYALLNARAIPLAHEVLMSDLNIPFVWHFKEGTSLSILLGYWSKLIDLYSYSDGQIYINEESKDWYEQFICSDKQMPFILDGDLPKTDHFTDDFSPLLSERDGEIHTVAPGRVVGMTFEDMQHLANQKIHLHLYVQNNLRTRENFISMANAAMGNRFHLHSPCIPQDWVKEFSQYDAGWLHCFRSNNECRLINVSWNDLNIPARINTLAAAGLPMLQINNQGNIVAVQSKVKKFDIGICFDSYQNLGLILKDKEYMRNLRKNVLEHRKYFSFDYYAGDLINFFKNVIDKKTGKI